MADKHDQLEDPTVEKELTESPEPQSTNAAEDFKKSDDTIRVPQTSTKKPGKLKRFWHTCLSHKKILIPVAVVVLLLVLAAVPPTRYAAAGLVLKKNFPLFVTDSSTGKPVSNAEVVAGGRRGTTDSQGQVSLKLKPGNVTLTVTKKYYRDAISKVLVPLGTVHKPYQIKFIATGRQVPVAVLNKLTGRAVENAVIKVAGTEVKTGKDGKVTIVLPADKAKLDGTISLGGYNSLAVSVTVSEAGEKDNTFSVTPSGRLYFLSKKSGKIDVVKTNLDGTDRQTVLAGTGNEEERGTVLLASRDWRYLALLARRDGDKPQLYLIDTTNDKLSGMDEGDATFEVTGWVDHNFVYTVHRNSLQNWQPKQTAIKTYNADTAKLGLIDETGAVGDQNNYAQESISWIFGVGNRVLYLKTWTAQHNNYSVTYPELDGKQDQIVSAGMDGTKKIIKTYAINSTASSYRTYYSPLYSYGAVLYEPAAIFFQIGLDGQDTTYTKLENDQVAENDKEATDYYKNNTSAYPTYLNSPSGNETFWSESRDGKNVLFVGDKDGKNGKEIGDLAEFTPYGWYTDQYVLVSKNGSELYIFSKDGLQNGQTPFKITDYHKPDKVFNGYGGGYGGI